MVVAIVGAQHVCVIYIVEPAHKCHHLARLGHRVEALGKRITGDVGHLRIVAVERSPTVEDDGGVGALAFEATGDGLCEVHAISWPQFVGIVHTGKAHPIGAVGHEHLVMICGGYKEFVLDGAAHALEGIGQCDEAQSHYRELQLVAVLGDDKLEVAAGVDDEVGARFTVGQGYVGATVVVDFVGVAVALRIAAVLVALVVKELEFVVFVDGCYNAIGAVVVLGHGFGLPVVEVACHEVSLGGEAGDEEHVAADGERVSCWHHEVEILLVAI